ncbi:type III secretion system chaperone [Photorhabdus laumondii]|uniref:type III secretion system chaperone n=1 Tax=Photorhabdus laumondii TaxID=2218628 RepID=UPI003315E1A1
MFNSLLSELCRRLGQAEESLHSEGLDLPLGPFSLHIRQRDELVTLFIPLGDVEPCSLATLADWPSLQLSRSGEGETLLWSREWLERLDAELLTNLVERMLQQARNLTATAPITGSQEWPTFSIQGSSWHKV